MIRQYIVVKARQLVDKNLAPTTPGAISHKISPPKSIHSPSLDCPVSSSRNKHERNDDDPQVEQLLIVNAKVRDAEKYEALLPRHAYVPELHPTDYETMGMSASGPSEQPDAAKICQVRFDPTTQGSCTHYVPSSSTSRFCNGSSRRSNVASGPRVCAHDFCKPVSTQIPRSRRARHFLGGPTEGHRFTPTRFGWSNPA